MELYLQEDNNNDTRSYLFETMSAMIYIIDITYLTHSCQLCTPPDKIDPIKFICENEMSMKKERSGVAIRRINHLKRLN